MIRRLRYRGRHRATRFGHTVADVVRWIEAERAAIAEVEAQRQRRAQLLAIGGRWAELLSIPEYSRPEQLGAMSL